MTQATISASRSSRAKELVADSFSKSVVLLACLMVLQRGIGFVRSFYVCGSLTAVEVGQWDLAFNFLSIAAPLAVLGIPGSFGRYLAKYETNGQQGRFLIQTIVACLGLTAAASILIWACRTYISKYFFGGAANDEMFALLVIGLPLVVFFNFSTCWFTGKRLNRVVFRIQFAQTLFFAVLCVLTFSIHSVTAIAVIISYLSSCFVGIILAAGYAFADGNGETPSELTGQTLSVWNKILPFAAWVWVSNALFNLFSVCDRLLLVNCHRSESESVQYLIGQYHTACILPYLLMTVGAMAASMGMPYLSKDWELGNRKAVTDRMNLMLKAIGLLCILGSVGILLLAPLLFGGIWNDRFAMGESLLPMALSYCSLAAMTFVAQKYFWCLEKTWISSCLLLVGLVANLLLGLALIGPFGIEGVVASTLVSHAIVLLGVLMLCQRHGMLVDRGVFIVAAALLFICFGKWTACFGFAVLALVTIATQIIFDASSKQVAPTQNSLISFFVAGKDLMIPEQINVQSFEDQDNSANAPSKRVLLLGNDDRVILAVARGLGREGISVHAAWCDPTSPALNSRYIQQYHQIPPYSVGSFEWLHCLNRLVQQQGFDLIIPCNDFAVVPLQNVKARLNAGTNWYLINDQAFNVAFDKAETSRTAQQLGINTPREFALDRLQVDDLRRNSEVSTIGGERLRFPVYVKPRSSITQNDIANKRAAERIETPRELAEKIRRDRPADGVLIQESFSGEGVGVEVLASEGTVLMQLQHRRLRKTIDGGSTYRETIAAIPELSDATHKLVERLSYTGVAMFEFRYNPASGQWVFLEINARFWGSLPLAIAAGVNFPFALYQLLVNGQSQFDSKHRVGVRCRNLVKDLRAYRRQRDSKLELSRLLLCRDHLDFFATDDWRPQLADLGDLLQSLVGKIFRRANHRVPRRTVASRSVADPATGDLSG